MYIGETFGLFSVPLSKVSFCITLLRLTVISWQKNLLWFIIVTVQITFYACAIITLVQCDPPQKLWDTTLPGKCWDNRIAIYSGIFVGGKYTRNQDRSIQAIDAHSIFCTDGFPPRDLSVSYHS
jgi:hypothetical protein